MALLRSSWYLINIKARIDQTPRHYIDAFYKLKENSYFMPISKDKRLCLLSIEKSVEETNNIPSWLILKFIRFVIIDPTKFFDLEKQENVEMIWNSNIVANKIEEEVIFVPSVHAIALRKYDKLTLNQLIIGLRKGFEEFFPETFDVNQIISEDIINQIKTAHAIISLKATLSFSNHGHASGFAAQFDEKARETGMDRMKMEINGTPSHPLKDEPDGFINAVTNLAERNGSLEARIEPKKGQGYITVNSDKHPRVMYVEDTPKTGFWGAVYNKIMDILH